MGYLSAQQTMERIEAATPESPIAVFRSNKPGLLKSVFAATFRSRATLHGHPDFIGVFDRDMDPAPILKLLRREIGEPQNGR